VIGLDTNVLVRFVMRDDPEQTELATCLIDSLDAADPGFVSVVTLVETGWVLSGSYHVSREGIVQAVQRLLAAKEVVLEREGAIRRALGLVAGGADFADAVITEVGAEAGCRETVTFDRRASQRAGMRLLE
jgi:predicted nucleic-acid-binding protein